MRSQKGITLIALVITIIIMSILVAVSVTIAMQGGLFTRAKEAKTSTQYSTEKEELLVYTLGDYYNAGTNELNISGLANDPAFTNSWNIVNSTADYIEVTRKGNGSGVTFKIYKLGGAITDNTNSGSNNLNGDTEAFTVENLFLYNILSANTAKISSINYELVFRDIPGIQEYISYADGNSEQSGSETNADYSETEQAISEVLELYYKDITIPDKVKLNLNGEYDEQGTEYTIVGFEPHLFNDLNTERITIPNTFTSIENYAFEESSIKSIVIPDSVTSIGIKAFKKITSLTNIYYKGSQTQWEDLMANSTDTGLFDGYSSPTITYNYTEQ